MMEIQFDRAVAVVPLGVLAAHTEPRYVSTDTIANVLRTYRKYLELTPKESDVVERLSRDLFEAMNADARSLKRGGVARLLEPMPLK
jgi:hypothetical protein